MTVQSKSLMQACLQTLASGSAFFVLTLRLTGYPGQEASEPNLLIWTLVGLLGVCQLALTILSGWRSRPSAVPVVLLYLFAIWVWVSSRFAEYRLPADFQAVEFFSLAIMLDWASSAGRSARGWILGLVFAAALGQAGIACYQIHSLMPSQRAMYEQRNPQFMAAVRQEFGTDDPAQLRGFLDRLNANDAMGLFGHPNSLACLLLVGMTIGWMLLLDRTDIIGSSSPGRAKAKEQARDRFWPRVYRWSIVLAMIIMFYASLLARSRSAMALVLVLCLACGVDWRRPFVWLKQYAGALLGSGIALAGMIAWLFAIKVLDWLMIEQTWRSFSYRLEWWWSARQVWLRSPTVGVGWGNFRNHYLEFKLPFSSEEIADPHQFLLELACNAGWPSVLLYGGAFLVGVVYWLRPRRADAELADVDLADLNPNVKQSRQKSEPADSDFSMGRTAWLAIMLAMGWQLLIMRIDTVEWMLIASSMLLLAFVFYLKQSVTVSPTGNQKPKAGGNASPPESSNSGSNTCWIDQMWVAGLGVLLVHTHWLTAGGIATVGLGLACWVLLATGLPNLGRLNPAGNLLAIVSITVYLVIIYAGIAGAGNWLELVSPSSRIKGNHARSAEQFALDLSSRKVKRADDWIFAGRMLEAEMVRGRAKAEQSKSLERCLSMYATACELDPRRYATYRFRALVLTGAKALGLTVAGQPIRDADILADWQRAVELYPHSATLRLEFAQALDQANDPRARLEYEQALWLDQTPHLDKKLQMQARQNAQERLKQLAPKSPKE